MAKRKASPSKITLGEFKAWLQGVEDMQPDNWTPTIEQWKRIREKIDQIEEIEDEQPAIRGPRPIPQAPAVRQPYVPPPQPFIPQAPAPQGSALGNIENPNRPNPAALQQADKIVTPNIDSSTGYESMFA